MAGFSCFAMSTTRDRSSPSFLPRRDAVSADDLCRPNLRLEAFRDDRLLLLNRPTAASLAPRDQLDPLRRSGHMTSLITAPYTIALLGSLLCALPAKPTAHRLPAAQGALNTRLRSDTYWRAIKEQGCH
jgi:hypothetical protein